MLCHCVYVSGRVKARCEGLVDACRGLSFGPVASVRGLAKAVPRLFLPDSDVAFSAAGRLCNMFWVRFWAVWGRRTATFPCFEGLAGASFWCLPGLSFGPVASVRGLLITGFRCVGPGSVFGPFCGFVSHELLNAF